MSLGTADGSPFLYRTRSAVTKLLERVKSEKPVVKIVSKPSEPVAGGRTKLKFPDPKKDCRIHFSVNSCNGKLSLPVSYENQEDDEPSLYAGLKYVLQVVSVERYSLDGKQLLSDKPLEKFYCCFPLSVHKEGTSTNTLGFWFRFFGQEAIFRITVALKLDVEYVLNLAEDVGICKRLSELFIYVSDNGIISTEEIDILIRPKAAKNSAVSGKEGIIKTAKISPSLYSDKEYKSMVVTFRTLKKKMNFMELEKFCAQMLEKVEDNDLRVVLLLEQSKEECRKKHYEKSKALLRKAVDFTKQCRNKTLLMGRAYVYLSHVHRKDGFLGNADECLAIARKKLLALDSCEDVGDLCFQEGLILTNFAKKLPKFAFKLIMEATGKFEQAVLQFKNGKSADNVLDKLCCSYIRLASLILQQKPPLFNKGYSVKQNIVLANSHLQWVQERLADLSERTKFHFYICFTELLYEKQHFEKAKESLNLAFEIAKTCQFEERVVWEEKQVKPYGKDFLCVELDNQRPEYKETGNVVNDYDIPLGYLADVSS